MRQFSRLCKATRRTRASSAASRRGYDVLLGPGLQPCHLVLVLIQEVMGGEQAGIVFPGLCAEAAGKW